MVAVPAVTPVITPVEPTVAQVDEEDHTPPAVGSVNVAVELAQTEDNPDIDPAVGSKLTVILAVALQPVDKAYVIVVVPNETPVTIPDNEPIVADDELLLQVPPVVASVSVILEPTHTLDEPLIAEGNGLTVIVFVTDAEPHALLIV